LYQYSSTTGSGKFASTTYNNLGFQSSTSDQAKWFLSDQGNGIFQLINLSTRYPLDCSSSSNVYSSTTNYYNDNEKWTSDGNYLRNVAYKNAYLAINGNSLTLSGSPVSWTLTVA
jgi:hypothetical protein